MRLTPENIDLVQTRFQEMKDKQDLLDLINLAKTLLYGKKGFPVSLKALTYYANPVLANTRYKEFSIRKKSGGERKIHAPVKGLKHIQRAINLVLQCVFSPHVAATGFRPGKSIVDNALVHQGATYVLNVDLKDFFPSIELHRIKACLKLPPFNLTGEKEPLAFLIANLCCTEMELERMNEKGAWEKKFLPVLPQGAPTSPTITNIVAQRLDRRLYGLARRSGARYTRYADDITFSARRNVFQPEGDFWQELNRIVEGERFALNPSKTRLQHLAFRQEVTGLVVNEKVNVKRRYVKQIRHWLYLWEKYGYSDAQAMFRRNYLQDKGHVKPGEPSLANVLGGKLEFLRMVKGASDPTVRKLDNRYMKLLDALEKSISERIDYDTIVDILLTKGLDQAMDVYHQLKTLS